MPLNPFQRNIPRGSESTLHVAKYTVPTPSPMSLLPPRPSTPPRHPWTRRGPSLGGRLVHGIGGTVGSPAQAALEPRHRPPRFGELRPVFRTDRTEVAIGGRSVLVSKGEKESQSSEGDVGIGFLPLHCASSIRLDAFESKRSQRSQVPSGSHRGFSDRNWFPVALLKTTTVRSDSHPAPCARFRGPSTGAQNTC